MALDSDNVLNSIVNVLTANTSTIANSLTSSSDIKFISVGDARNVPVTVDQYPGIMIKLAREVEEFAQIGQRLNKHQLEFDIALLAYSAHKYTEAEQDIRKMTRNVKSVLKNEITLSGTALWSLPEIVDYFPADIEGTYLAASLIFFRTHHLST